MTVTDRFRAHLLAAGRAPRTARLYVGAVWRLAWEERRRPDFKWVGGVTRAQVREWVDAAAGLGTRRLRLSALRAFFGWAVAEGLRRSDPTRGLSVSAGGRKPVYAPCQTLGVGSTRDARHRPSRSQRDAAGPGARSERSAKHSQ